MHSGIKSEKNGNFGKFGSKAKITVFEKKFNGDNFFIKTLILMFE